MDRKIKIIILEDDLVIAENLKENLIGLGYKVVGISSNTDDFIEQFNAHKPQVCIADIFLKGSDMNGVEIMKKFNIDAQIPVIYLTAYDDIEVREMAKHTYSAAYLLKPASKKQLDATIDLAISNFQKYKSQDGKSTYDVGGNQERFFFLKTNDMFEKVKESIVSHLKAMGTYTEVITWTKKYTVSANLKNFLSQYQGKDIVRCHRSFAVNMNYIKGFDETYLYVINGNELCSIPYNAEFKANYLTNFPRIKAG